MNVRMSVKMPLRLFLLEPALGVQGPPRAVLGWCVHPSAPGSARGAGQAQRTPQMWRGSLCPLVRFPYFGRGAFCEMFSVLRERC